MFKQDIIFDPPYMNAAGYCGFRPDPEVFSKNGNYGAFVSNPISYTSRKPAGGTRYLPTPGGFLLHTGLPNPGFYAVLKKYSAIWSRSEVPIILHLIAEEPGSIATMVRKLEEEGSVSGIELGFRHDHTIEAILDMIDAANGELPIIARVPTDITYNAVTDLKDSGAFAISLAPPRGIVLDKGKAISGRLQGPCLHPRIMQTIVELQGSGLNLIPSIWQRGPEIQSRIFDYGTFAIQVEGFPL